MKRLMAFLTVLCLVAAGFAENYLINGGQESQIRYQLTQRVEPANQTKSLTLSYVIPENFESPTYRQKIENFKLDFQPQPSQRKETRDRRGNPIVTVVWDNPSRPVDAVMQFTAKNKTVLAKLESQAPFPPGGLPSEIKVYTAPSEQVQSNDPAIRAKSQELVRGVQTEFDAVQRILTWVVDHMRYVTPPEQFDALYSFGSGKGNCQNFSHLAAALMRPAGIPARIVNGATLDRPYTVKTPEGEFTFKLGNGRHSWIEVYFPDLGWVPFDPQQTELFVSNRFIRVEVGVDNAETVNDGMVKWKQARGAGGDPKFQESIAGEFPADDVRLTMQKQTYGPQGMLICPDMKAVFKPMATPPPPPPPAEIPNDQLGRLAFRKPFSFGNLDFPRGVDFLTATGNVSSKGAGEFAMQKSFMVETAEYVTSKMTQYAQVFVLRKPMKLSKVALALHNFGGRGQLWVDLLSDAGGKPGSAVATSDFLTANQMRSRAGYDWVEFDLTGASPVLQPGKYWVALGFTGSPIVNWFYTYGKPVGPVDGTRYKGVYETDWSGALAYEFNYRVSGLISE
jgi:hypothetical protein